MKYFQDHVTASVFNNQADLARTLDPYRKRMLIESPEISPLTVRLFNVKSGFDRISDCVHKLAIQPFPTVFTERGLYNGPTDKFELYGIFAPSGSVEYAHSYLTARNDWKFDPSSVIAGIPGCYVESPEPSTVRIISESAKVHTFNLHSGVYDFFSNLNSAFDRVRLELNSIYFDGTKELNPSKSKGNAYWRQYLDPNNAGVKSLVSNGWNVLASILTGPFARSLDQNTSKYRHRLIHDGDLETRIDSESGIVYVPDDPLAPPLTFGTELLPFLTKVFSDVQVLFRDIYEQIIVDINAKKKIPII
jgi:hypothetical protein